ncbi:hypothetical protein ACLOJK_008292 [Asimina triloba]
MGFYSPSHLPPLVPLSPVAAPLSPVTAPALVPFTLSLSPLTVPLSLLLPPSPFSSLPTRRSPLSPSPTRHSSLPLAAPLSPLVVADSSFPSPSRYPSRHRRLVVSLSLLLPPSGSPLVGFFSTIDGDGFAGRTSFTLAPNGLYVVE